MRAASGQVDGLRGAVIRFCPVRSHLKWKSSSSTPEPWSNSSKPRAWTTANPTTDEASSAPGTVIAGEVPTRHCAGKVGGAMGKGKVEGKGARDRRLRMLLSVRTQPARLPSPPKGPGNHQAGGAFLNRVQRTLPGFCAAPPAAHGLLLLR